MYWPHVCCGVRAAFGQWNYMVCLVSAGMTADMADGVVFLDDVSGAFLLA